MAFCSALGITPIPPRETLFGLTSGVHVERPAGCMMLLVNWMKGAAPRRASVKEHD